MTMMVSQVFMKIDLEILRLLYLYVIIRPGINWLVENNCILPCNC